MGAAQTKPTKHVGSVSAEGVSIDLENVPVRIDKVHILGLGRTQADIISPVLNKLLTVRTFEEMVFKASEVQRRLEKLGCFRSVSIVIDTSKGEHASQDGYEIIYKVQEIGRIVGGVNTMIGANEGSVIFDCRLPNLAGRGERIAIQHTLGSNSNKSTMINFTKPFGGIWNSDFTSSAYHHKIPSYWSGFTVFSTGTLLDFSFESAQRIKHKVQYEGTWRQLEESGQTTSFEVREQSGHSFKSAIRHVMTVDHRDHHIFPTTGVLFKSLQEFAGLSGDAAFLKQDSELQYNIALPFELVLQGAVRLGLLKPLNARTQSHNISDLFFLGGPQSIRGFQMKSLGSRSRSGKDALGGKAYWASALHLYSPLPFNLGRGTFKDLVRLHVFLNAGNITDSINTENLSFQALVSNFRTSYGVGVAMRLGQVARIELNYCWPFKYCTGDKLARGVQLGIGLEFL